MVLQTDIDESSRRRAADQRAGAEIAAGSAPPRFRIVNDSEPRWSADMASACNST